MINTINNKKFKTANQAYEYLHDAIIQHGIPFGDTKALFNVGFYITEPLANAITNKERKWNIEYAQSEFLWYLSGDRNITKLGKIYGKIPPIWIKMADENGNVLSNYGWQWKRQGQLQKMVAKRLKMPVGIYYHFAHNMHLYNDKI